MGIQTIRAIGWVTAAAVLAGCTTSANGSPTPGTQPTTPESGDSEQTTSRPSSPDETYGAPRVTDPLDAGPFLTDPCALLTPTQQTDLSITRPPKPDIDDPNGPGCLWNSDQDSGAIGVSFLTPNKNGLSDIYRGRDQGHFVYFVETTVAGYPAVHADILDSRATGSCGVIVGISDTLTFLVDEIGQLDADGACARARQAAAAVIATLQRGT